MEQQGGQQVGRNGTSIIHHLFHDPRGHVVGVEALMLVGTGLLCFIAALGSYGRGSSSWCIRTLVWAVYTVLFFIFTYTIGFMRSSSIKNELYPVWAVSFFAVLGCTNSITAYELDDNKQWMRHLVQLVLYYTYISMMLQYMSDDSVLISVSFLFAVTYYKNFRQICACILASRSWDTTKLLADYMKQDADPNMSRYDPISLEGYNYLVSWAGAKIRSEPPYYQKQLIATENVVTIEQIWHFDGRLMKSAEGAQLKDVCLPFALYHLLKRCYFGFSCAESGLQKTHDFVFRGLLVSEEDYNGAFNVIEVEYVTHVRWKKHKFIERVLAFLCKITLYPRWQNKIEI